MTDGEKNRQPASPPHGGMPEGGEIEAPRRTILQESWILFRKNRLAMAGMIIFIIFFIVAVTGLFLTTGTHPYFDPALVRLQEKLRPPLSKPNLRMLQPGEAPKLGIYLLGTDELGRDVFSRMLQGSWVSLTVGFVAVGIAIAIGVFLGGMAGFYGNHRIQIGHLLASVLLGGGIYGLGVGEIGLGVALSVLGVVLVFWLKWGASRSPSIKLPGLSLNLFSVDILIVGLVDIMLCFPSFFLILTVVALLSPSIYNVMAIIGLTSWMGATRFVRAEFLSLRERDFVTAARALGVSDWRIIFRHMVPNAMAPVLVSATIGIATAILTEAGLSFLGFGVPPPHATWGNILSDGKDYIFDAPWLTFIPGLAILIVVLAFNLFGEGLRDALNPRLREQR
jgi:peptide/nickel transport system permease protein